MVAVMGPQAPTLIRRIHAVRAGNPDGVEARARSFLPPHVAEIYGDDPGGMRAHICEVISGPDGASRMTAQEQQSSEPQQSMQKRRDAFIDADAPLHPWPVNITR